MKTKPQATAGSKTGTLAVTGEGQIKVRPDLATIDLDVLTTGKTAQEASEQNAQRMTAVIAALKAQGIAASDLQTVGFGVMPVIEDDEKSPNHGKITSYRVISQLRAHAHVDAAGEIIDAAINAGANMASGIRFGLRDDTQARTRALKAAVKAARREAETVAEAAAVKIKSIEAIEANMGGSPILFRSLESAKSAAMPVEAGTIDLTASVRMVFRCG